MILLAMTGPTPSMLPSSAAVAVLSFSAPSVEVARAMLGRGREARDLVGRLLGAIGKALLLGPALHAGPLGLIQQQPDGASGVQPDLHAHPGLLREASPGTLVVGRLAHGEEGCRYLEPDQLMVGVVARGADDEVERRVEPRDRIGGGKLDHGGRQREIRADRRLQDGDLGSSPLEDLASARLHDEVPLLPWDLAELHQRVDPAGLEPELCLRLIAGQQLGVVTERDRGDAYDFLPARNGGSLVRFTSEFTRFDDRVEDVGVLELAGPPCRDATSLA